MSDDSDSTSDTSGAESRTAHESKRRPPTRRTLVQNKKSSKKPAGREKRTELEESDEDEPGEDKDNSGGVDEKEGKGHVNAGKDDNNGEEGEEGGHENEDGDGGEGEEGGEEDDEGGEGGELEEGLEDDLELGDLDDVGKGKVIGERDEVEEKSSGISATLMQFNVCKMIQGKAAKAKEVIISISKKRALFREWVIDPSRVKHVKSLTQSRANPVPPKKFEACLAEFRKHKAEYSTLQDTKGILKYFMTMEE